MIRISLSSRYFSCTFVFISSILVGAMFTFFFLILLHNGSYSEWLDCDQDTLLFYDQRYDDLNIILDKMVDHGSEELPHIGSRAVADVISSKVKVFCLVLTTKHNHATRAVHVNNTWLKHCNGYVFASSSTDELLGAVNLGIPDGREYLRQKTEKAFKFVYYYYLNEFDWFLKADDDTYVVVENLRLLLLSYSPEEPIYFGCNFLLDNTSYMSGGAGYVLSRTAVKAIVENGFLLAENFIHEFSPEDFSMGVIAELSGVKAGVSVDTYGRPRFFPISPEFHTIPRNREDFWLWTYSKFPMNLGLNCCSDFTISFHYVEPAAMYILEFLIYHLTPFGIFNGPFTQQLPVKESEIWRVSKEFAAKFKFEIQNQKYDKGRRGRIQGPKE